jgi:hypothetical protein
LFSFGLPVLLSVRGWSSRSSSVAGGFTAAIPAPGAAGEPLAS